MPPGRGQALARGRKKKNKEMIYMKNIKRIFSLLLIATLMIGAVPSNVQATSVPKKVTKLKVKQKTGKYKSYKENKKIHYVKYKYMQLSWKKIKGVTGYEIYRYGEASKTWHKVKTVASNKTTYAIPEVEKNMKVKLKVRAYRTSGIETVYGEFSTVKSFTGKKNYWLNGKMKSGKYYKKLGIYEDPVIQKGWYRFISERAFNIQNKYRAEAGKVPLEWNELVYQMAQIRSKELEIDYSHDRPSEKTFSELVTEVVIKNNTTKEENNFGHLGENVARGQETSTSVMKAWKNSSGHYKNIIGVMLDQDIGYKDAAICLYIGKNNAFYWDALFMIEKIYQPN